MPVAANRCEWVVVQNGQHEPIQRPLARCRVAEGKKPIRTSKQGILAASRVRARGMQWEDCTKSGERGFCLLGLSDSVIGALQCETLLPVEVFCRCDVASARDESRSEWVRRYRLSRHQLEHLRQWSMRADGERTRSRGWSWQEISVTSFIRR